MLRMKKQGHVHGSSKEGEGPQVVFSGSSQVAPLKVNMLSPSETAQHVSILQSFTNQSTSSSAGIALSYRGILMLDSSAYFHLTPDSSFVTYKDLWLFVIVQTTDGKTIPVSYQGTFLSP